MSQARIDRLRAGLERMNRTGELPADAFAPGFELRQASSIIDTAGDFHGPGGIHDAIRELAESFENLSFEPEEFFEAPGDEMVVFIRVQARGRGSGLEMDNHIAWVLTYLDDKVVRLVVYEERAEALAAVGLPGTG
jgi:ketosteroid isomerase-like protein